MWLDDPANARDRTLFALPFFGRGQSFEGTRGLCGLGAGSCEWGLLLPPMPCDIFEQPREGLLLAEALAEVFVGFSFI